MGIDWQNFGNQMKNTVTEAWHDGVQRNIDVYVQEERQEGTRKMTAALHESKVADNQIIQMLQKFYEITISEAENYLRNEKVVQYPCRTLCEYLVRTEGLSREEAYNFIQNYNIPGLLEITPDLWKKKPAEIFQEVKTNYMGN